LIAASYAPAATPQATQAIASLELSKTAFSPTLKSVAFATLFASGTNTSLRYILPF